MSIFTRVNYDNPFNSTEFTDCCKVAVTKDEDKCPSCDKHVLRIREQDNE